MKTEDSEKSEEINKNEKNVFTAQKKVLKDDFFEQMSKITYFEQLSAIKGKLNEFSVNIKVSGFDELNSLAGEILKICIYTLQTESGYASKIAGNSKIDILSLLELAVQLMPENLELLDELHRIHLKMKGLKMDNKV